MAHTIDNLIVETLFTGNQLIYDRNTPNVTVTTTTASGTLTLTVSSLSNQIFSGTATGYSVVLPNATTLTNGWTYNFFNNTTQTILIKDAGGNTLISIASLSVGVFILQSNATSNGTWAYWQVFSGSTAGLIYYKVTLSTTFTTTSTTDVIITGTTVTPISGTYAVWYNGASSMSSGNKTHWWSVYNNGTKITDSERRQGSASANGGMVDTTITTTTVAGGQAIDIRLRSDGTSTTVTGRTLIAARIAN